MIKIQLSIGKWWIGLTLKEPRVAGAAIQVLSGKRKYFGPKKYYPFNDWSKQVFYAFGFWFFEAKCSFGEW